MAVDRRGGECIACAGGVFHGLDGPELRAEEQAAGVAIAAALRAECHIHAAAALLKQPGDGRLQRGVIFRVHFREDGKLHAVGLHRVKIADQRRELLCARRGHGVQVQRREAHLGQMGHRAAREVAVAHHDIGVAQHHRRPIDERLVHPPGDAHVAHGQHLVALLVENGHVARGALALQHARMAHVDARRLAAAHDAAAALVVAHDRHQLHVAAQARQILADVAAHAAQRRIQHAGVGIPHDQPALAPAADVHVCCTNARNVAHTLFSFARDMPLSILIYCTLFPSKRQGKA